MAWRQIGRWSEARDNRRLQQKWQFERSCCADLSERHSTAQWSSIAPKMAIRRLSCVDQPTQHAARRSNKRDRAMRKIRKDKSSIAPKWQSNDSAVLTNQHSTLHADQTNAIERCRK
jgi:hypothetical protein